MPGPQLLSRSAAASRLLPSAISIKKGDKGPSDSKNTLYCSTSHRGADGSSTYPRAATESHCRGRYLGPINHSVEGTPAESPGLSRRGIMRTPRSAFPRFEIISGSPGELVGPTVDDGMAIDIVDASHDALLELQL